MAFYHATDWPGGSGIWTKLNPALAFLLLGPDCRADPTGDSSDNGQRDTSNFGDALSAHRASRFQGKVAQLMPFESYSGHAGA
jgi:hypothetical protein